MPADPPARVTDAGDTSRLTPLVELQLVEAHRRGDPEAVGRLLAAYQRRMHAICHRMVRDDHTARDLTQESMLKVLQGLDGYDGRAKLSTWIIRVTMNCCLSHLRKQKLRRHASLDASTGDPESGGTSRAGPEPVAIREPTPPGRVEQAEMQAVLGRALSSLDPEMRAVLVLRDMQELEYHRIAEALEVPVGTIKSRLFRARLALREAVEIELERGRRARSSAASG